MYQAWLAIVCAGIINPTQYQACLKSLEAFGLQSGITQTTKKIEDKTMQIANKETAFIGNDSKAVLGFLYSAGIKKELVVNTSIPYPFQNIEFQGHPNNVLLLLKWNF